MLNYLIAVTENTVVVAVILGVLYAFIVDAYGLYGRKILTAGVVIGLVLAAVNAILKNTTKFIDNTGGTGMWNVRIFTVSTVVLILYYIFSIKKMRNREGGFYKTAVPLFAAILSLTLVLYALPDVMAYPFNFTFNDTSVFSTAFFYRLIGYIIGLLLMILTFAAANKVAKKLDRDKVYVLLNIMLLINGIQQITKIISVLHAKRVITGRALFKIAQFTSNNSKLFIYLTIIVAFIIPLILLIRSMKVNEPYENPAEKRKIAAKWRNTKRWSSVLIGCFIVVVIILTLFAYIDGKEVELSPAEECEVRDDNVYVSLAQVDDGHLHRFEYTTDDDITVRFIVIKKPNSSSYGIGLDACDICGETGYFERNGQIVCKLCDVVMNINTIGFKGGCNPIVIDYSIADGYIIVPIETLVEHQDEFK